MAVKDVAKYYPFNKTTPLSAIDPSGQGLPLFTVRTTLSENTVLFNPKLLRLPQTNKLPKKTRSP